MTCPGEALVGSAFGIGELHLTPSYRIGKQQTGEDTLVTDPILEYASIRVHAAEPAAAHVGPGHNGESDGDDLPALDLRPKAARRLPRRSQA